MADDIVQIIENARVDATSLSEFIYYPANVMVQRRLAPSIHTLNYYLDYLHGLELIYSQPTGTVTVNGEEVKTVRQSINDAIDSVILGDYQTTLESQLAQESIRATNRENEIEDALDFEVIRATEAEEALTTNLNQLNSELNLQKYDTGIIVTSKFDNQVPKTLSESGETPVNIKSFSEDLVSGGDATNAIQLALNSGARLIEVSDNYIVTGNLNIPNDNTYFFSKNKAVLDFSFRSSKANCITAEGTDGAEYTVSIDINKFSTNVTTDTVPTAISAGDIVVIKSDEKDFTNQEGFNGEMLKVASVSGSNIVFTRRIRRNYLASKNIKVQKMNMMKNITVDGISFIGTGKNFTVNDHGVTMRLVENPVVKNCTFDGVLRNSIRMDSCYNWRVSNNTCTLDEDTTTSKIYYGICWLNYCTKGVVANNTIYRGRHGIVQSEDLGYGTSHETIIFGNTVEDTYAAAYSTHSKVSDVLWSANISTGCGGAFDLRNDGNVITGSICKGSMHSIGGTAIALRGRVNNTVISGSNIFSNWRYAAQMFMSDDNLAPSDIEINGASFVNCTYGLFFEHFGTINSDGSTYNVTPCTDIRIIDNTFNGGVSQQLKMAGYFTDCTISDNKHKFIGSTKNYAMFLQGLQNSTINEVVMRNSYGAYEGDVSVKNSAGGTVLRKSIGNVFGNLTAFNQDAGFKVLTSVSADKANRLVGDVVNVGDAVRLISADTIVVDNPFMIIDTEGLAATDNLATLTGLMEGQKVTLCSAIGTRKITIKHATGNIQCGADIVLNSPQDTVSFIYYKGIFRLVSKQINGV